MLEQRSLLSQFTRFTGATVASLMVFSLYSIVDGLFVAKGVGEFAMAAVNLAVPFTNILFSIAVVFAVGANTIIAIYLGRGEGERADSLLSQNLALLTVIGAAISLLVLVFTVPFARLLGANETTLDYTVHYLRGLAPFALCFIVSYNMEILVKTDGYPRIAIATVVTGCLTNCALDYLAIFVLNWGVWGAAVATGLSQLLTCVIYLRHFLCGRSTFHIVRFRMDWRIYRRLLPLGVADGVTELCNGVMIFLFNHVILRCIGDDGLVSYSIIAYTNTLIVNTMLGISQGSQPLVSYHYGREDHAGCRKLLRYALTTVCVAAPLLFLGLYVFAPQIVSAYLSHASAELVDYSVHAFRRYSISYLLVGFNVVIGGFLTALERPVPAISISVGRGLVLQSAVLLTLAAVFGGDALWYTPILSEAMCLAMSLFFLRRYRREHRG